MDTTKTGTVEVTPGQDMTKVQVERASHQVGRPWRTGCDTALIYL